MLTHKIQTMLLCLLVLALMMAPAGCSSHVMGRDSGPAMPNESAPAGNGTSDSGKSARGNIPSSMTVDKSETVYVTADAAGVPQKVRVSARLRHEGTGPVRDRADLRDLRTVGGDETFTQSGTELVWENLGRDIEYEGESDAPLPVDVKVTYYLNGKETAPEEMAGKSGEVRIVFSYENRTEAPFLAVSAAVLDAEKFSAVEVTNGRVIANGDSLIALGMSLPGLSGRLRLSEYEPVKDTEIPETVEITARATDFSLSFTATVLTPGLSGALETGDLDELEEKLGKTDDLEKSSDDLQEASDKLSDGVQELSNGIGEYVDAVGKVNDGAGQLRNGADALAGNSKQLRDGAKGLADGLAELSGKLSGMSASGNTAVPDLSALDPAVLASLPPEIQQQLAALADMQAQLTAQMEGLKGAVAQLSAGASALSEGVNGYTAGVDGLAGGVRSLQSGTKKLAGAGKDIKSGLAELKDGTREFAEAIEEFRTEGLEEIRKLAGQDLKDLIARIREIKKAGDAYRSFSGLADGKEGEVTFIVETKGIGE
ncbi:MAG: hypothetical protein IJL66_03720 [Lachnospiraceae bacterium]|nr:hypothetical protein [Lachnospiraceae bacterium]